MTIFEIALQEADDRIAALERLPRPLQAAEQTDLDVTLVRRAALVTEYLAEQDRHALRKLEAFLAVAARPAGPNVRRLLSLVARDR